MNQLVMNFFKEHSVDLQEEVSLSKLNDEFYNYIFKIYLSGYIKK